MVNQSVPDLKSKQLGYPAIKSVLLCRGADGRCSAELAQPQCPEELILPTDYQKSWPATAGYHGESLGFRSGKKGQLLARWMPFGAGANPLGAARNREACFYKTLVREAQNGCAPAWHSAFAELSSRFIPRYLGCRAEDDGEWIVTEDARHGLEALDT